MHTANDSTEPPTDNRTRWLPAILIVIAVATYANSLPGQFVLDDGKLIVANQQIRQLWPATDLLRDSRPLVAISLAINYAIGGLAPEGYHLFNLAIHVLAGLALYGVIRRTVLLPGQPARAQRAAPWLAATAALLFLIHPLTTQAVTYIIQRAESMMGLFYLLTLYAVVRSIDSKRTAMWYAAAAASCALGMASKTVMVTAPAVILLYDYTFLHMPVPALLRRRWPLYAALAACWSIPWHLGTARLLTLDNASTGFAMPLYTWSEYALTQLEVITHYLRLSLWPHPLCIDYAWRPATSNIQIIGPNILIAALVAATFWGLIKRSWIGFLGAAFFIILSPTSSIVPIADIAVEHRMYLPLAAVIVLACIAAWAMLDRAAARLHWPPIIRAAITAALILATTLPLALTTINRNFDYWDPARLWQQTATVAPLNARAYHNLGAALDRRGQLDQAMACYERALSIAPGYTDAHNNLGGIWLNHGRIDKAIEQFHTALTLNPDHPEAHYNLSKALMAKGDPAAAEHHLARTLDLQPHHAKAHNNLGLLLLSKGKTDTALTSFRRAIKLEPTLIDAYLNLASALLESGQTADAIATLHDGLTHQRDDPRLLNKLSFAHAAQGDFTNAVRFAEAANRATNMAHPMYLKTLAAAYAQVGRLDDAIQTAHRAADRAQSAGQPQWAHDLNQFAERLAAKRDKPPRKPTP